MTIIEDHRSEFNKLVEFFQKDIQGIRTNRASADLVSTIMINVYDTKTPLEQLASISVPEPRTLVIQPWDKNILKEIEKTLSSADLGTTPTLQDNLIRLTLPPLNEESRNRLVKILHAKLENARNSLRIARDKVKEEIIKMEREKEIGEDEKYRLLEELDKVTREYQEKIKEIEEIKEKEITTI